MQGKRKRVLALPTADNLSKKTLIFGSLNECGQRFGTSAQIILNRIQKGDSRFGYFFDFDIKDDEDELY